MIVVLDYRQMNQNFSKKYPEEDFDIIPIQQKFRFVLTKNLIKSPIQFVYVYLGLRLFSFFNAFHFLFLTFCFQVSKTQLFLLRLFVAFVDLKFKLCCEFLS